MIYVQIASYKDPELPKTLDSLFENSRTPLKVVVLNQGDLYTHPQAEVITVPPEESKGVCWARRQLQDMYQGEPFTLMLDSHHRFVAGWDIILLEMYQHLKARSPKPLITTYLPSYDPQTEQRVMHPWRIDYDKKSDKGVVMTRTSYLQATEPVPAKFFSAHFAFTEGNFCNEIKYDDQQYFLGEELILALKAFTHGYDMFHPNKLIAWHEYTREGRKKHWDDDKNWWKRDLISVGRYHHTILTGEGMGTKRTIQEYEQFIGVEL